MYIQRISFFHLLKRMGLQFIGGKLMTKQEVIKYLTETPGNTNPAVLSSILNEFAGSDNKEEIELSATENKVYTPAEGKVYNKVTVNVPASADTYRGLVIDMNGGYWGEDPIYVEVLPQGGTFVCADWYAENESYIYPPTGKVYGGITLQLNDPNQLIDSWTMNFHVYLHVLWDDEVTTG